MTLVPCAVDAAHVSEIDVVVDVVASWVGAEIETVGAGAPTGEVEAERADVAPTALDAVTTTRSALPTVVDETEYAEELAPAIERQPDPPELQLCHSNVYAVGLLLQLPVDALRTCPTTGVPAMVGATRLSGAPRRADALPANESTPSNASASSETSRRRPDKDGTSHNRSGGAAVTAFCSCQVSSVSVPLVLDPSYGVRRDRERSFAPFATLNVTDDADAYV